jgi:hypothetical protein
VFAPAQADRRRPRELPVLRRAIREAAGPARQDRMMGLPTSQQRALNLIEKTLVHDHPSLGPLFAIFTALVDHEAMPVTERVTARPWWSRWRIRPAVATLVGLAMVTVALFALSLTLPSPQVCPGTFVAVAAHAQSVPTGRLPACATQQNKRVSP